MQAHSDVRVTIRVDKDLKDRADALFDRLGMNMTTALNVFLRKAVTEEAIPFPVSVKNVVLGHTSSDITSSFEAAVRNENMEYKRQGFPVARYDAANKQAYLEVADGSREYVRE